MIYLTMTETDGKYLLWCDEEGVLIASESPVDAIRNIEDGYFSAHERSYEGSMSACINYIFFHHSVVSFTDMEEVKKILVGPPFQLATAQNVSGRVSGLLCDTELARPYFEKGDKPRLVPGTVKRR